MFKNIFYLSPYDFDLVEYTIFEIFQNWFCKRCTPEYLHMNNIIILPHT